jgi:hypothetical protein
MLRVSRVISACVIALCAIYGLYAKCFLPLRCDIIAKRVQARTPAIVGRDSYLNSVARQNVEQLSSCLRQCDENLTLLVVAAANESMLARNGDAVRLYQRALTLDRRPELYVGLALAQLGAGERSAATQSYLRAARFDRFALRDSVPDPAILEDVRRQLAANSAPYPNAAYVP